MSVTQYSYSGMTVLPDCKNCSCFLHFIVAKLVSINHPTWKNNTQLPREATVRNCHLQRASFDMIKETAITFLMLGLHSALREGALSSAALQVR